jgi:hypothetical protein
VVSRTFVRPFVAADVPAAGVLLAQRHARHRLGRPLLSLRYEDSAAATAELASAFGTAGASGAFAVRGGEPAWSAPAAASVGGHAA